jgi:hypothetical protein
MEKFGSTRPILRVSWNLINGQRAARERIMPTDLPILREKLLLSARDAAGALSVSQRTLWSMTQPRGAIPAIRLGARVLYSIDDLRRWIAQQTGGAAGEEDSGNA